MAEDLQHVRQEEPRKAQEQYTEERRYLVPAPVARYYSLLVGLLLVDLGILGLAPQLTAGGVLLGLLRVTPVETIVHLVTGLAGVLVFFAPSYRYARRYPLVLVPIYLVLFTAGNIAFGNAQGRMGPTPDIQWIFENALHAGLFLTGALVGGLSALQRGDKATKREHDLGQGKFGQS
jgi:hypothetical protein